MAQARQLDKVERDVLLELCTEASGLRAAAEKCRSG